MKKILLVLCLSLSGALSAQAVIDWSTPEGIKRLERSKHKADFFPLANHFESQKNKVYCGPASAVIVLNALRIGDATIEDDKMTFDSRYLAFLPKGMSPYFDKYTQDTFFNKPVSRVKTEARVCGEKADGKTDFGFQLRQLEAALKAHGLNAKIHVVEDVASDKIASQREEIRKAISENLTDPTGFVLVNFSRKSLGQQGTGHISPVGAYDRTSDSFLILDVNPNTAKWSWVTADALIGAMRTKDTVENRGYLTVDDAGRTTSLPKK